MDVYMIQSSRWNRILTILTPFRHYSDENHHPRHAHAYHHTAFLRMPLSPISLLARFLYFLSPSSFLRRFSATPLSFLSSSPETARVLPLHT